MAISRQQEHFVVMTVIYNELSDFSLGDGKEVRDARELISSLCECPYSEVSEYVKKTVSYALNNFGAIKDVFIPKLNNWKWERLPLLTQAILLMSYAHMQIEKIDKKIVIDVAVNLAKKYVEPKQGKFVNAILDGVL